MPAYEFRCRQCGDTFIVNRPMSESSATAICPAGHTDTVRLLNVAAAGTGARSTAMPSAPSAGGGGCCGGGCCG